MQLTNDPKLASRFSDLTIKSKLFIAFGLIFSLVAIVAIVIFINTLKITDAFRDLTVRQSRLNDLADNIRYYDVTLTDAVRAYLIDPQDKVAYDRYFQDATALDQTLKEAQQLATSAEDVQTFKNIDRVNVELVKIEEALLANPDLPTAVTLYRSTYGTLKAEYSSYVKQFFDRQAGNLQAAQSGILASLNQSILLVVILVVSLLVVSIVISLFISRDILSRLLPLGKVASDFAKGEFDGRVPVKGHDELSNLAETMNDMLGAIQKRDLERTHLIKDLQTANALTKESARLKSEFMSTMSHELRTPLNATLGFSSILLDGMGGEIDADARHMIERISSNSERLLTLINGVLDIAKIEAGRLEILSEPMTLRELASKWQMQMSVLAEKKNLTFDVNVDPVLPTQIYGDAERLSQITINLLSNAFKFTDKGSVSLNIKRSDLSWIIEVADTGIGIPPHALNYIFDEFRQVDGSTTRVYGGSGLGLAIVRNLCQMMDGTIKVTSELKMGSTFTVTLPLKPVAEAVAA